MIVNAIEENKKRCKKADCNPSYSRGGDQEDGGLKPTWAKS
jgi:hypothetical protein